MRLFVIILGFIAGSLCAGTTAKRDTIPSWIDTVAPKVQVLPKQRYHGSPVFVSFSTDKKAVVKVGFSANKLQEYDKPIAVSQEGKTSLYYYAEDMFGNRTALDSVVYVLDFHPPVIEITPEPGLFNAPVVLHIRTNKPCRLYRHSDPSGSDTIPVSDSLVIKKEFTGYISAIDRAGNTTRSSELSYVVDTSTVNVRILPPPGIYGRMIDISFQTTQTAKIFYTFDALAPAEWFKEYTKPARCPYGLTVVRYYAVTLRGRKSLLMKSNYVIDTIPPKIKSRYVSGRGYDTLELLTKEKSAIRYTFDKNIPFEQSRVYEKPLAVPRKGRGYVKALAVDAAGNRSELYIWEHKYDTIPPVIKPSHQSGTYISQFTLSFSASKPVKILYTLDGSAPNQNSPLCKDNIVISKGGLTTVRYIGVDEAENYSAEGRLDFMLDIVQPRIKVKIEGIPESDEFRVILQSDKPARIYYEIGEKEPAFSSSQYIAPLTMKAGQTLRYFGVDAVGNRSEIIVMNELKQPMVSVIPDGGVYNKKIRMTFKTTNVAEIYWRMLPDTVYSPYKDTIILSEEGAYTLEYYAKSGEGYKGPVRRNHYSIDWTAPRVTIAIKKKGDDSVLVFFQCNKNATIYYTADGTNPLYSKTTKIAGNKFTSSSDRISLARNRETKLAFIAEDLAGNMSSLSVLDIFKPHAVPNIPAGADRVYNRILSLSLSTYDEQSQIYYERHGKMPTVKSPLFSEPITLVQSDTVRTFVVDASGYTGDIETFIYLINLPPSPQFTYTPERPSIEKEVTFNASGTLDHETDLAHLLYRWDFNSDGKVDYKSMGNPIAKYTYVNGGVVTVTLEVMDPQKCSEKIVRTIPVIGTCPGGMVYIPRENNKSFCIDRYEWPNTRGKIPLTKVSWIRAKMYCYDEGKRLCSLDEWEYACQGGTAEIERPNLYPYGTEYKVKTCPTEGDKIYKSGQFFNCRGIYDVEDMVGNVWEWVNDRQEGAPVIVGGSYEFGAKAQCRFTSESSIIDEAKDIGFRCCR